VLEAAAAAGLGVAVLPCFLGDRRDDLVRLGERDDTMTRDLWLVVHRELQTSRCVRAVADYVVDQVRAAKEMLSGQAANSRCAR
jgi:DNA-binding transcriptional LysR family regulator